MARYTNIELTNMLMIQNPVTGAVLVEDRQNPNWPGVTFPGGHVEVGETVTESVYREAHEETGLTIANPKLVGIKEWPLENGARYIVFLYHVVDYSGQILSGREGQIFWTTLEKITSGAYELPNTFLEMLPVFTQSDINELALGESISGKRTINWQ